ncbi:MAG: hypothetical protein ABF889_07960 [Bifidobacterium sp.]
MIKASLAIESEKTKINISSLSEDDKVALAMQDLGQSGFGVAVSRDGNKRKESEHFADEGA